MRLPRVERGFQAYELLVRRRNRCCNQHWGWSRRKPVQGRYLVSAIILANVPTLSSLIANSLIHFFIS